MILADAINWPLAAGIGFLYLGPLTLAVSLIEAIVFSVRLKVHLRTVFKWCLLANILSTIAGGVVSMYQGGIVYHSGITDTIPAFVRGFLWVCPILILIHFAKSFLVEGLILTRRFFLQHINASWQQSLKAILIGNLLSYLLVGPMFYYAMRPHFSGLETTFDTKWVTSADEVLYYIDHEDDFIKRINMDGSNPRTLVPFPAVTFQMSADESTFAFIGTDLALHVYRTDWAEPKTVMQDVIGFIESQNSIIPSVSISPDHQKLAYRYPETSGNIHVFDFLSGESCELTGADSHLAPIHWSSDGNRILVKADTTGIGQSDESSDYWMACDWPPGDEGASWTVQAAPAPDGLVENYSVTSHEYVASWRPRMTN